MNRCQGCGKPIVWGTTPSGDKIPLDPSAPVYKVTGQMAGGPAVELLPAAERRLTGPFVSHFSTCPKASDFSFSRKVGRPSAAGS